MPLQLLKYQPGVVKDISEYAAGKNGPFWVDSDLVRFKNGYPEKLGGWVKEQINALDTAGAITNTATSIEGIARRMVFWRADSDGEDRLAVGTHNHLLIIENGAVYDITPLRDETNAATTTSEALDNSETGIDLVSVAGFTAAGAVIIGSEIITYSSISSLTLTGCTRGTNSTSAAAHDSGATVTQVLINPITTADESTTVTITNTAHGAKVTDWVVISGAAATGGVTADVLNSMAGHQITEIVNANSYKIVVPSAATSTVSAGGGLTVVIKYLIGADAGMGAKGAVPALGWGVGGWGLEGWSDPRSSNLEGVFLDNTSWNLSLWGEDLIASVRGGAIYYYDTSAPITNRASLVSAISGAESVPTVARITTVSFPDRHFIVGGAQAYVAGGGGDVDNMLVRWSSQEQFEKFAPTATNTAGDQRLQIGTKIVAMVAAREETIISTDEAIYGMTFVGGNFVFSFRLLSANSGAAGLNTMISVDGNVFWMSKDGNFYQYDGIVKELPCPVREYVFGRMQTRYIDKVNVGMNKSHEEITWFYVSNDLRYELNISEVSIVDDVLAAQSFCGTGFPFPGKSIFEVGDTLWISTDTFGNGIFGLRTIPLLGCNVIVEEITSSGNLIVRLNPINGFNQIASVLDTDKWKFVSKAINRFATEDVRAEINSVTPGANTGDNPEPDSYVTYDYGDNVWSIGSMPRTVWSDAFGARDLPFAFDPDGYLYNHETGTTADGASMNAFIETSPQEIDGSGNDLQLIDKIVPDANLGDNTTLNVHLIAKKYAQSQPQDVVTRGPLPMTTITNKISTRIKGRQVAVRFQSGGRTDEWELGTFRVNSRKDGLR